jgi:hypothetical protein
MKLYFPFVPLKPKEPDPVKLFIDRFQAVDKSPV